MANEIKDSLNTFDHVVVLMLENRSFDNLLGYLYEDGVPGGKSYEGLQNGDYANPIPPRVSDGNQQAISPHKATDYHQPFPDPGEEYSHINTQLYNVVDSENIAAKSGLMKPPFNLPADLPGTAPMTGFVNDYINKLQSMSDSNFNHPSYDQYSTIMQCFKPDQVSVTSNLAKSFSVFDHWFCSVPSQTWCNRAFWHAATSGGFVINPMLVEGESKFDYLKDMLEWKKEVWSKPTLFSRLSEKGVATGLYSDNPFSLTRMVNGHHQTPKAHSMDQFYKDLQSGGLAEYVFVEPKFLGQHNDQHPSSVGSKTHVGTVLLGEKLIYDVYNAIKNSDYRDKTLFVLTQDEHGGCFDHVSPPKTVPPEPGMEGQNNFKFDRLGIRVPTIMISSYIAPNTIINDTFDHTSFLRTMREKWDFEPLNDRDRLAGSFASVFSEEKREWPDIPEPILPVVHEDEDYHAHPLNDLQKSILHGASALAHEYEGHSGSALNEEKQKVKKIDTVGKAMAYLKSIKHHL